MCQLSKRPYPQSRLECLPKSNTLAYPAKNKNKNGNKIHRNLLYIECSMEQTHV